jgi:hypothetical protein
MHVCSRLYVCFSLFSLFSRSVSCWPLDLVDTQVKGIQLNKVGTIGRSVTVIFLRLANSSSPILQTLREGEGGNFIRDSVCLKIQKIFSSLFYISSAYTIQFN